MYFVLANFSAWLSVLVLVAIIGWMKASLLFKTPNRKRFLVLFFIDGGYFAVASVVFILLALV
jgi:hypothetical protein